MKRYLRTNSRVDSFNTFKARHKANLCKRDYSCKFANHHANKIKFLDRSFELTKKTKKQISKIPFITRYTPSASTAIKIIKKYWPSPMLSYKSNGNIKSFLVREKLPSLNCESVITPLNEFALDYTPLSMPDSH